MRKGTADVLVLFFTAILIVFIMTEVLLIQSHLNKKYKESIKEDFREFDEDMILLSYLKADYYGKPLFDALASLKPEELETLKLFTSYFFKDSPGYWNIIIKKNEEAISIEKEEKQGDNFNNERYAISQYPPSAIITLPLKDGNTFTVELYYFPTKLETQLLDRAGGI